MSDSGTGVAVGVSVSIVSLVLCGAGFYFWYRRRRAQGSARVLEDARRPHTMLVDPTHLAAQVTPYTPTSEVPVFSTFPSNYLYLYLYLPSRIYSYPHSPLFHSSQTGRKHARRPTTVRRRMGLHRPPLPILRLTNDSSPISLRPSRIHLLPPILRSPLHYIVHQEGQVTGRVDDAGVRRIRCRGSPPACL